MIEISSRLTSIPSTKDGLQLVLLCSSFEEIHVACILKSILHLPIPHLYLLLLIAHCCLLPFIVRNVIVLLRLGSFDIANSHEPFCVIVSSSKSLVHKVYSWSSNVKDGILMTLAWRVILPPSSSFSQLCFHIRRLQLSCLVHDHRTVYLRSLRGRYLVLVQTRFLHCSIMLLVGCILLRVKLLLPNNHSFGLGRDRRKRLCSSFH
jgi:hypothetical protein